MNKFEAFTLFTTGARITVLAFLIITLSSSIRQTPKTSNDLAKIAQNPRYLLAAVLTLLAFSSLELVLETIDHWSR